MTMTSFKTLYAAALRQVGSEQLLEARLPTAKTAAELAAQADAYYLSLMSRRIFRAGLRHSMVDERWPAFEEVFMEFEPRRVRAMHDENLEALMGDRRLIRHWGKIKSVRANAAAMCEISAQSAGFGAWLGNWPGEHIVDLWAELAKRFAQLGGSSAQFFLRMAGKDTFLVMGDGVRALNHWGIFDGAPKGKKDRERVQVAINEWAAESGRPLCEISMILALSAG